MTLKKLIYKNILPCSQIVLQNNVENNKQNEKIYKFVVEEKIDNSSQYELSKGIYLEISHDDGKINIYKDMFKTLSYADVITLFESCFQGLHFKPFPYCDLACFRKVTIYQRIRFDKGILEISESKNDANVTIKIQINNINVDSYYYLLTWIANCLDITNNNIY
jgi:hypothetical protein